MNAPSSSSLNNSFCPRCAAQSKPVKRVTLESLLKSDALSRAGSAIYHFCPSERCDVVYFGEKGDPIFSTADLKVRVGIKETAAPRPLCYCFNHSAEEIDEQIRLTGKTSVLDDIKTRMKEACWCETKNPQGSCCLASVTRYVKAALEKDSGGVAALSVGSHEDDCCVTGRAENSAPLSSHLSFSASPSVRKAEQVAMFGSMVSGVLASACCWLPLLLLAAGISGVAVGAALERYRPILLAVTFALLGAAFYLTYRPRFRSAGERAPAGEGESEGAITSECCSPTARTKYTLQKMNRVMLWIVAAITLAFALFPNYVGLFFNDGRRGLMLTARGDSDAVFIAIEGMTCKACATVLEKELAAFPGIASAEVSYEKRLAVLHFGRRSSPRIDEVLGRIKNAGYDGAVMRLPLSATEMSESKSAINQEKEHESKNYGSNR